MLFEDLERKSLVPDKIIHTLLTKEKSKDRQGKDTASTQRPLSAEKSKVSETKEKEKEKKTKSAGRHSMPNRQAKENMGTRPLRVPSR